MGTGNVFNMWKTDKQSRTWSLCRRQLGLLSCPFPLCVKKYRYVLPMFSSFEDGNCHWLCQFKGNSSIDWSVCSLIARRIWRNSSAVFGGRDFSGSRIKAFLLDGASSPQQFSEQGRAVSALKHNEGWLLCAGTEQLECSNQRIFIVFIFCFHWGTFTILNIFLGDCWSSCLYASCYCC